MRLPISFRNQNLNPAKLANVQLLLRPIFSIQRPMFGIEHLAFESQSVEAGIGFRNKSLKPAKLATNVPLVGSPIFNIQCPMFGN